MGRIPRMRKGWAVAAVAFVALVVAGAIQARVGTTTGGDEAATVARDASSAAAEPAAPVKGSAAMSAGSTVSADGQIAPGPVPVPPPDGGPSAVVPGAPRVVRTADLRVEVAEGGFTAAFDRIASIAAASGGFVSASTTSSDDGARSGELTVRVPADRFDSVRQSLSGLGEVESQSIRGEDVSGQLVDYDARLTSLRAQEDALRVLVGQAREVGDVLRVQSSLFSVRQQIEQIQAQKANLEQSVTLATIQVSLFEPGAALVRPDGDDSSLARSFEQAVDGMLAVVGGMIVVVGYLVPIAVLGLLGWVASRVWRRRPVPQAPAV
jgi:hypothetical protein